MSKNFELLRRAGWRDEVFDVPAPEPATQEFRWSPPQERSTGGFPGPGLYQGTAVSSSGIGREEATKLVRRIFLTPRQSSPRMVTITGARQGVGCSWVSALAAQVLASQTAERVCLIDANFRTPAQHKYFRIANQAGLSDALLHSQPAIDWASQIAESNLWVLCAGAASPNVSALASFQALRAWVTELRTQFGYILVDSPPVNSFADAIVLGQVSDGMILVVESSRTPKEAALRAKQSIAAANVPLLGAVLNKRTFAIPKVLYRFLR